VGNAGVGPFYEFGSAAFAVGVIEGHLQGLTFDTDGGIGSRMRDGVRSVEIKLGLFGIASAVLRVNWLKWDLLYMF